MPRARKQKSSSRTQDGVQAATAGAKRSASRLSIVAAFIVFVIVFGALAITSARRQSATFDEPIHLMGGYSYLKWHDYRINPEHPPLVKLWAALPLLGMEINDPRPFTPYWNLILKAEAGGPFYPLIQEMFFARNDGENIILPS